MDYKHRFGFAYNIYSFYDNFSFQSQMPDTKTYKQHFENKHPKNELPPELKDQ